MKSIHLSIISLILAAALLLEGCGALIPPKSTLPTFSPAVQTEATEATAPAVQTGATEASAPAVDKTAMLEAYQFALEQLCYEHKWPDGSDAGYDSSFGFMEENRFAITDIDADGQEELLINFTTTYMAGMTYVIYGYDTDTNQLHRELTEFPAVTLYEGGIAKADASHNHSYSMSLWPYSLYRYDQASDTYALEANVSGWEKEFAAQDYDGRPFPDDKAENGMVYRIEQNGATVILSPSEYRDWEQAHLPASDPIVSPYQPMSPPAIHAVSTGTMEDWRRGLPASEEITWGGNPTNAFILAEEDGIVLYQDSPYRVPIAKAPFPKPLPNAREAELTVTTTDLTGNGFSDLDVKFRFPDGSEAALLWLWDETVSSYCYNEEFSHYPGEPTGRG